MDSCCLLTTSSFEITSQPTCTILIQHRVGLVKFVATYLCSFVVVIQIVEIQLLKQSFVSNVHPPS
jgi:hypothetical protein